MQLAPKVKLKNQRKRKNRINFQKISDYQQKVSIKIHKMHHMMKKIKHFLVVDLIKLMKEVRELSQLDLQLNPKTFLTRKVREAKRVRKVNLNNQTKHTKNELKTNSKSRLSK